jgi:hypothetical protein
MADKSQPDAIAMLKADHRKVEELFARFESTKGVQKKQDLVGQICVELTIHTILEEDIFYPSCRGKVEDDLLDEAFVEHDGAKVLVSELQIGKPDEAFYDAKVKVLSEQIDHHVKEEEKPSEGIFAQARASDMDMDELASAMRARKEELMVKFKDGLPKPETKTFTGPALENREPEDSASKKA